jgi:type I restriction enzyme, S subunit
MKEGWEIKRFKDVCELIGGSQPSKGEFIFEPRNGYIRLIQVRDYRTTKFITYIPEEKARRFCNKEDIMIGRYGPPIFGIFKGLEGAYNVALMKAKVNEQICYKDYFYWFLKTSNLRQFVEHSSKRAAGQDGVRKELLDEYPIPLPSISEQKRIVGILEKAFAAIAKAKANSEQNCKNAKEIFEGYLQKVFEEKGEKWEEKMLGEVLVKTESIDPTKKPTKEFVYLDVSSVNKETKQIENATVLLGKDAPSRARKLIKVNDVIFATVRPTHSRIALITKEYDEQVCSTGYFVLRAKEFLDNNLVFYFLLTYSFNKQMEKLQKGASYPAVTDSEVKGIYISFPKSFKTQQSIVKKLDHLSTQTKKLEAIYKQKINDLEELKKSILEKAFKGDL